MNWLNYLRALPRQLMVLLTILFALVSLPAHAQDPGSRTAAGSGRTLSNLAYIRGDRAGLQVHTAWTEADVVYRKSCMVLSGASYQACTGSDKLDAIVAQTIIDWQECNSRYGVSCRVMVGGSEDASGFIASDAGQTSARGGLIGGRIGFAMTALESKDSSIRHWLRPAFMLASHGGANSVDDRFVELWVLPPDVGADFANLGYRPAMTDLQAEARLEAVYAARNMPDANMFVAGFLLNLQNSKGPAWVTIPVNGLPTLGKGPIPEECDLELENPMSRSQMASTVNGNAMSTGGEQVTLTYVRERWVEIASCPTWVPNANDSEVSVGGDTFIWDLSTGDCRKPAHDEDGIITPEGVLELEIALRKEKQFRADSEGFARHIVALSSQDGFWLEGDYASTGYMRVHFDGLCSISMHNAEVTARKEAARIAAEEIAFRKAELVKIDDWYTRSVRLHVSFEGLAGGDILLSNPNPYSADASFVGGGMVGIGPSFGNDMRRLVLKGTVIPQWHGGEEFYAYAPAGVGFGGALAYQGGFRGDVGSEIAIGYYHSFGMWTDAGGDRFDDLDDTMYTQWLLRIHPRGDLLGTVNGRQIYRTGAHTGAFIVGVEPSVMFRSGLEPGSMMTLAEMKAVVGWTW